MSPLQETKQNKSSPTGHVCSIPSDVSTDPPQRFCFMALMQVMGFGLFQGSGVSMAPPQGFLLHSSSPPLHPTLRLKEYIRGNKGHGFTALVAPWKSLPFVRERSFLNPFPSSELPAALGNTNPWVLREEGRSRTLCTWSSDLTSWVGTAVWDFLTNPKRPPENSSATSVTVEFAGPCLLTSYRNIEMGRCWPWRLSLLALRGWYIPLQWNFLI